jgi:hypothetical protein
VTEPKGPLGATRDDPILMELDGRTFLLWVEGGRASSGAEPRRREPVWTVKVDGAERRGWSAAQEKTLGDVRAHLAQWWNDYKGKRGR